LCSNIYLQIFKKNVTAFINASCAYYWTLVRRAMLADFEVEWASESKLESGWGNWYGVRWTVIGHPV